MVCGKMGRPPRCVTLAAAAVLAGAALTAAVVVIVRRRRARRAHRSTESLGALLLKAEARAVHGSLVR